MLGWLKRLPERWLHARRRREAIHSLEVLGSGMGPGPVVFICFGNICRSPFAAELFRQRVAELKPPFTRQIRSAGFIGPGRGSPSEALEAAEKFGIDLSPHRSTLITPDVFRSASLIVTMSAEQVRDLRNRFGSTRAMLLVLGDLDPEAITERTIKDPWGCPPEIFDESYERIDRCVSVLVSLIAAD